MINTYSGKDLKDIIKIFGEEDEASKISKTLLKKELKKTLKLLMN